MSEVTQVKIAEYWEAVLFPSGESKIIKLLKNKAPQTVTYREIYKVYSHPSTVFKRATVQKIISRIRCRLPNDSIKNVMTIGYYWNENA